MAAAMDENGQTREPRGVAATGGSHLTVAGVAGAVVNALFPDLAPELLAVAVGAIIALASAIGSAARDSEFLDTSGLEARPIKRFLVTLAARLLG